jgi:hypothetical protein
VARLFGSDEGMGEPPTRLQRAGKPGAMPVGMDAGGAPMWARMNHGGGGFVRHLPFCDLCVTSSSRAGNTQQGLARKPLAGTMREIYAGLYVWQ